MEVGSSRQDRMVYKLRFAPWSVQKGIEGIAQDVLGLHCPR